MKCRDCKYCKDCYEMRVHCCENTKSEKYKDFLPFGSNYDCEEGEEKFKLWEI